MTGIVGMVLISLASAGVFGFLSNEVSAEVEVLGPVFYLDKAEIMGDDSYSLKLNDNGGLTGSSFSLRDGDILAREFFSESLGVSGFYPAEFEVVLDSEIFTNIEDVCDMLCRYDMISEAENMTEGECITHCEALVLSDVVMNYQLSGTIDASLYLVSESGRIVDEICSALMIGVIGRDDYGFSCKDEDNVMSGIGSRDRLRLLLSDGSSSGIGTKTYIGDSFIQVVAQ